MQICRGQCPLEVGLLDNTQYSQLLLNVLQSLALVSYSTVLCCPGRNFFLIFVHSMWYINRDAKSCTVKNAAQEHNFKKGREFLQFLFQSFNTGTLCDWNLDERTYSSFVCQQQQN